MKRFLCTVLCLAMVWGMVPAVAADTTPSDTYSVMGTKAVTLASADTSTSGWYVNGSVFSTAEGAANYIEVSENGYLDAGALHVYQDNVANNDMSVGLFTDWITAGTYTLKLYVKGDLGYMNQACKLYPYGHDGNVENLHTKLGDTMISDWTEVVYEDLQITKESHYLIFMFSKYNWVTDMYIDNIRLINSSGVDVLSGAGNFCTYEEVTCSSAETKQYPAALDTSRLSSSGQAGEWVPFTPYGIYQKTWPEWDNIHYGEIVADGFRDAGSLHLVSASSQNAGVIIKPGMVAGQSYTLGLWIKGTATNANKVLALYGNGDGSIVGSVNHSADGITGSTAVSQQWQYVERTFTATKTSLAIFATDWGENDLYIDNITLKNAQGEDLLAGCGDFYTQPAEQTELLTIDTSKVAEAYTGYAGQWTPFCHFPADQGSWQGTWPAWDDTHYGQIVASGNNDPGALHLVSAGSKNAGVAIDVGMKSGESYTLGLWVRGTAASNKMLALYGNGGGTIIGNPVYCADAVLSSVPAEWTYVEKTFTADRSLLILLAADWGDSDLYIDNITLKNASGIDLLAGYGDFCVKRANLLSIDTTQMYGAYDAPNGIWSVMYPAGSPNDSTWPAWDDTHYGQIVENGYADPGALHLVSASQKNTGVAIGVDMTDGEKYTLGLWAKGTSNSGRVLFSYANGDPIIIGASGELNTQWTYYEITFTCSTSQLNIVAADWGETDIYIDNITLTDSQGTDLLAGYGDFCVKESGEEPEEPAAPGYKDPTEAGWIGRDDYTQLELGVDYDYSFAILGDIQHITDYTPTDLHYLFDYILDNKDAKNIQFVFGMGDTTNDNHNEANNLKEWKLAQEQFFRLNGVLPYTVVRGNHDVVTRMNAYFADPSKPGYTDQLDGFYQEGSVVNVWKEFSVAGVDYLNILIDYESSDSVLAWASDVIESHPNHRVIVGTHVYLNSDGTYDNEMNPVGSDPGTLNNAQQVWDKLISQHENIFMVTCGHVSTDDVAIQQKYGVHGNLITEIRVDSQYTDLVFMNKDGDHRGGEENGVGMVTMLYFKNDGTQVAVEHYSALRGWYRELQTFQIEPYAHYGWRYDQTQAPSLYRPDTKLQDAPVIFQDGMGTYTLKTLLTEDGESYAGTGAAILPDYNMNLGTHTYALHSGTRTVEPSQTYTVSYQIKGLNDAGRTWTQIHFCRSALGGSDTWESQWQENQIVYGPVDDWQTVSYDVTMDDKTSAIEVYFIVGGSELYIDNFSVVKKDTGENAVTNGDFEQGIDGAYPTGFYAMKTGGLGTVEKVSGAGVNGTAAVRIEPRPGYLLKTQEALAASANTEYILSYTVRIGGNTTDLTPMIRLLDAEGNVTEVTGRRLSGATDWTRVSYSFLTKADTVSIQPCLVAYGGRVDVDDLSLTAGGAELLTNGDFDRQLEGFAGEFLQGLQEGKLISTSSARPGVLTVDAQVEDGVLYAGSLGTVDWLYGQLQRKMDLALRIDSSETAAAVAVWAAQRKVENLWVIAQSEDLLTPVLAQNSHVRAVLDCTEDMAAAQLSTCPYVLIAQSDMAVISQLRQDGKKVLVESQSVTQSLLRSGADGILTVDSGAAIATLEAMAVPAWVDAWNLSLAGDIGVNFYIQVEEAQKENTRIQVAANGTGAVYHPNELTQKDGSYLVTVNMAAAQMTEAITVEITVGEETVWQKTYTVREYADTVLNGEHDAKTKTLVAQMLHYGAAAQIYFDCDAENPVNAGLPAGTDYEMPAAQRTVITGHVTGVSFYGASLLYQSQVALRLYVAGDVTDCSVTCGGQILTLKPGSGMYYVQLACIDPAELDDTVTVTVTKNGESMTVSYSPLDYIARMYEKGSGELQALLQAMYQYHLAAESYLAA